MYPPVGLGQVRVNAKRDLTLAGGRLSIPAGTALWVPHHAMHNAKHNWDRPEDFLPGARLGRSRPLANVMHSTKRSWDRLEYTLLHVI